MTSSERFFVCLVGGAMLLAVLSVSFVGFWPVLICLGGLIALGVAARISNHFREEERQNYLRELTPAEKTPIRADQQAAVKPDQTIE